ncbi:MAG: NADPH-dependent glutamate synthase [Candidatus Paraimprobicoccus trichonymphae]|uniref:NADPH-dependent glutamate synthase n=1 Tax=Candidatus Paraimprobicoccus trichonymphae TaxID=3033793 RepID=A0AA48KW18_9FIRM|nr:MAG: NADPH-dependent glutamate synthase [Candidatus Paraimprobicoccus trichonymphae]
MSEILSNCFEKVNKKEEILKESFKCLNCKKKYCVFGCPIEIDIPKFIAHIKNNNLELAHEIIKEKNLFPSICSRVCPVEKQCESMCIKNKLSNPVSISRLEKYVADLFLNNNINKIDNKLNKKICVVGSGPSGLACALKLAQYNYEVNLYEKFDFLGGVLAYGIPEFRLPKDILNKEIEKVRNLGVRFNTNIEIGKDLSLKDLFKLGNNAVYISTGAEQSKLLNIPGENFSEVYPANVFLRKINIEKNCFNFKIYVIIGGGNVAIDSARCAKKLGNNHVTIMYRKSEQNLCANRSEILNAKKENIDFIFESIPTKILGNNKVEFIEYLKNNKQVYKLQTDCVVFAIGSKPNDLIKTIERTENNLIITKNSQTSQKGVYAGGDVVTGPSTVVSAIKFGMQSAKQIHLDLQKM